MSKIALLRGGNTPRLTDGVHVFKIASANYDSDFGKVAITMETFEGAKHFENFGFIKNDGAQNEGALKAFSALCRAIFGDVEEVETADLVGKFVKAEIIHENYTAKDGSTKTKTVKKNGTWWETPTEGETSLWGGNNVAEDEDINFDDLLGD